MCTWLMIKRISSLYLIRFVIDIWQMIISCYYNKYRGKLSPFVLFYAVEVRVLNQSFVIKKYKIFYFNGVPPF